MSTAERVTAAGGVAAVTAAGAALIHEFRRSRHPGGEHAEILDRVHDAHDRVVTAVDEARQGFEQVPERDLAYFHLLGSFFVSAALARGIALRLKSRPSCGPFREVKAAGTHIHHMVPGVGLMAAAGTCGLVTSSRQARSLSAIGFGTGMGLVMDESALLLYLDDVYWTGEGLVGAQITLGSLGLLTAAGYVRRLRDAGRR